ncbi:MAG TPA: diguanylate cyclase [Holophaga sp.]|nr:diguanylate cyclase [Holophaga sp.]
MSTSPGLFQPSPILPAEREVSPDILEAADLCRDDPALRLLVEATDLLALVLDAEDRVVALSGPMQEALGPEQSQAVLGLSPGEAFGCLWASLDGVGCGCTASCAGCGVFRSVQACRQQGMSSTQESVLLLVNAGAWTSGEYRVRAAPVRIGDRRFSFLSIQDFSDSKRREALEHFFFKQILNLVNALEGTVRILSANPESAPLLVRQLSDFTEQLSQEVQGQHILLQAENGSLQVEPREIELSELMESLEAFFRNHDAAHKRRLEIRPYQPEAFSADPTLLLKLLLDLVVNAFHGTPVGGTVRVQHVREADQRRFIVHHPGVIPPEAAARVFDRSANAQVGRGLGTFGLRLIAERYLQGRLGFTSTKGEGTTFELRLPASGARLDAAMGPLRTAQPKAAQPRPEEQLGTVLIVDDAKVTRHLVQSILSKDFQVYLAETGQEALALAAEHQPDLVLLDAVMPGMDGYAVCRRLKAGARTKHIPIIFLTALTGKADETLALESGAVDFITKPVSPDVVYARVRKHVELKQAQDRLEDLSLQDGLTSIPNRRAFDRALEHEWRRGIRSRKPLSMVMGDVDFFKRYNDSLGHQQGDVCLCQVAKVFASAPRRPSDLAARYGGEEFACVLGDTDAEGAMVIAERIRAGIEALGLPHPDSELGPMVTMSLGIATLVPDQRTGLLSLVELADRRLYEAKRRGRNQVAGSD